MISSYVKKARRSAKKPKQNTTKPQHKQKNNLDVYVCFLKYSHFSVVFLASPDKTTGQF